MKQVFILILSFFITFSSSGQQGGNYTESVNGVQIKMVFIKGGTFNMGSPNAEDDRSGLETLHPVTLSDYYIGKFEITQEQWTALMGENPSFFTGCDNCPVENVSWIQAQAFVEKLSELTNKKYFLPTEAQWEFACRAETGTVFHTGNCMSSNQANFDGTKPYRLCNTGEYKEKTLPVGSFKANSYGLFDMHGNVHEWCSDWYGAYSKLGTSDPKGPDTGTFRVIRGGNWSSAPRYCRSACRNYFTPDYHGRTVGFRIVCVP